MASLAGEEGKKQQGCDNEAFLLKNNYFRGLINCCGRGVTGTKQTEKAVH